MKVARVGLYLAYLLFQVRGADYKSCHVLSRHLERGQVEGFLLGREPDLMRMGMCG
jgi:hypothetical protein